jgi:uncharacterized membrane protein YeaQ/YmgE (transglycosylase-associated protein family)
VEFLLFILMGAAAGWIASLVMGTNTSQGTLTDVILGIIGAVLGGFVMNMFGQEGVTGFNLYSLVVATIGAVVLLFIGRMFTRRSV